MSRGVQAFKQTDAVKALKAAKTAGLDVQRFEIDRAGKIVIVISKADDDLPSTGPAGSIPSESAGRDWTSDL